MASQVVFVRDPAGWNHAFHSWDGVLGKWMSKKTVQVQVRAMAEAPVKTGATKGSIRFRFGYSGTELESTVGVLTQQGLWVHEGTRPHVIRPRNPEGHLVFFWPKVMATVVTKQVFHPGIRSNPFLVKALHQVFGRL